MNLQKKAKSKSKSPNKFKSPAKNNIKNIKNKFYSSLMQFNKQEQSKEEKQIKEKNEIKNKNFHKNTDKRKNLKKSFRSPQNLKKSLSKTNFATPNKLLNNLEITHQPVQIEENIKKNGIKSAKNIQNLQQQYIEQTFSNFFPRGQKPKELISSRVVQKKNQKLILTNFIIIPFRSTKI
ncbi:hypothetical protein PPERSA_02208 [Pseudocohnilembus persalinus]|uniref:Uncharacterized protein n=1 Tax=Pseudocohnilembus persalinus TaxID=266149 RepID=A0A0V0Q7P3_PSEPJ|nr:hypothetical protein PPERSA_02208 [Pseudocohnilembus persalinus]|eukprot:KRW98264.1 hypothetical protein PPERSA_02208 [Pseudocohnilembus persalinus]